VIRALLLLIALGWLYFRLRRRMRRVDRVCARCGQRNPRHQTRCGRCLAPLSR
jgi:predicted amidophosphoribosyltransferase